jgi:hypothetical protein
MTAFFERYKAGVGYLILAIGVTVALVLAGRAIREADTRAERQAAVICQNTTRQDKQSLSNLYTKSGHELLKSFNLTVAQARVIIHRQLVASAAERSALQPSDPKSACSGVLTTFTPAQAKGKPKTKTKPRPAPRPVSAPAPAPALVRAPAPAPVLRIPPVHKHSRVFTPTPTPAAVPTPAPPPAVTNHGGHTPHGKAKGLSK